MPFRRKAEPSRSMPKPSSRRPSASDARNKAPPAIIVVIELGRVEGRDPNLAVLARVRGQVGANRVHVELRVSESAAGVLEEGKGERHALELLSLGPDPGIAAGVLEVVEGVFDRLVELGLDGLPDLVGSESPCDADALGGGETKVAHVG